MFFLSCFCYVFECAVWSPAGNWRTSWLSFVVLNCEFVTFSLVSWVRCGTYLHRFLIFAPFLLCLNTGSHFVQLIRTNWEILSDDLIINLCVIIFLFETSGSREDAILRYLLSTALAVILFRVQNHLCNLKEQFCEILLHLCQCYLI